MLRTFVEVNIPDERMGPRYSKLLVLHEERSRRVGVCNYRPLSFAIDDNVLARRSRTHI